MKKGTLMITILLASLGCILIVLSIIFLYQGNYGSNDKILETKKELEEAKKEIQKLSNKLNSSQSGIELNETSKKIASFKEKGINYPIVEITDIDLGIDEGIDHKNKKVHRLMYNHQIRFYLFNVGKNSLKDVIFSVKDIYNYSLDVKKRSSVIGHNDNVGDDLKNQEIGAYENFEVNTLNLKSRRLIYASTLPSSYGTGDYTYHIVVEWKEGFYQMNVKITEKEGQLSYKIDYFDVNGNPIDL
jgi:hypothetical protein